MTANLYCVEYPNDDGSYTVLFDQPTESGSGDFAVEMTEAEAQAYKATMAAHMYWKHIVKERAKVA